MIRNLYPLRKKLTLRQIQEKLLKMGNSSKLGKDKEKLRAEPGERGMGKYYRIILRDKKEFSEFRYNSSGINKGIQRLYGKKKGSSFWLTQAWLVSKKYAHKRSKFLYPDTKSVKKLVKNLGSKPVHVKGDIFKINAS